MFENFTAAFLKIVRDCPAHEAVITDGTKTVNYAALDVMAQKIAAYLERQEGGLVALSIGKSAEYIAALLGCWYVGRAFIPLDPELPPERRAFILNDARPPVILTAEIIGSLPENNYVPVALTQDALAYVIYTSGSTGEPKGVMVMHNGLVQMLKAQIAAFGLHSRSRSLFYLSTSFDASLSDIGTALLSGAALCIETGGKMETAAQLGDIFARRGITYADIPPSLLRLIDPEYLPATLDTIVIGGEPCPPETVRAWASKINVINVYGPTEATVCTSLCRCDPVKWERPLIGDLLPGIGYYIFDVDMKPCEEGELYIGGAQLAAGYLNRAELTAKKFIQHNGQRLYKTGDLVRRHASGDIEFMGRIDRQVKLNGQLVELEEIEAKIMRQPGIGRAAVIKRNIDGRDVLAAFVTVKAGRELFPEMIAAALKPFLPPWMIPAHIVVLDKMPVTASGKTDFTALRFLPLVTKAAESGELFTSKNDAEEKLLKIWQRILKKEKISGGDDFFALGGDSIAVLDLCLSCERFGFALSPAMVATFPTLAVQAKILATPRAPDAGVMTAEALKADVAPDDEWRDLVARAASRPPREKTLKQVFITGATGFLGAALLAGLLEATDAFFHVLVRAANPEEGWARLNLPERFKNRIAVVTGDIGQPQLGLTEKAWDELAQKMDTVIHCAATVNMVKSYADLRQANVDGTRSALQLALQGRRKALHYASTLSVFVSTDRNEGTALEDDTLESTGEVYGGYAQSKWAAEYLLQTVPKDACDISIYRLGLITGDSASGRAAPHDFLSLFVRGIIATGTVPQGAHEDIFLDVTPVDYAAQTMAKLICSGKAGTCHIASKKGFSLGDILRGLKRAGVSVGQMPPALWQEKYAQGVAATTAESAAFMALCRLMPEDVFTRHRAMDLFQATGIVFDTRNTERLARLSPPPANDSLMDLYLRDILS